MLRQDLARSISDLHHRDLGPRSKECGVPAMGICGRKDNNVSPKQGEVLHNRVDKRRARYSRQSAHFPMLDETGYSHEAILDFLTDSE